MGTLGRFLNFIGAGRKLILVGCRIWASMDTFTWSKGRLEANNIQCLLDRCFASIGGIACFDPIKVTHLPRYDSDHAAIRIMWENHQREEKTLKQYIFKFEDLWARDSRCERMFKELWKSSNVGGYAKLKLMLNFSEEFKEYRSCNMKAELNRIEELLKDDKRWDPSEQEIHKYKALEAQRTNFLRTEEVIWRQCSRAIWLKEGIGTPSSSTRKLTNGGKQTLLVSLGTLK